MSDEMYVVVNLAGDIHTGAGHKSYYVMPGENPHTVDSLQDAVEIAADLSKEFGHNLVTAGVFRLVRVPTEAIQEMYDEALKREEE